MGFAGVLVVLAFSIGFILGHNAQPLSSNDNSKEPPRPQKPPGLLGDQ